MNQAARIFEDMLANIQETQSAAVGSRITLVDLDIFSWYIMSNDNYLGFDFAKMAPRSNKIVKSLLENPAIEKFYDEFQSSNWQFTAMGEMY